MDEAIESIKKALEVNPDYLEAYTELLSIMLRNGDNEMLNKELD